jgi:hypothetical protein
MVNVLLPPSWTTRSDPRLVERLVRALYDDPATGGELEPAGPDRRLYLLLSDLAGWAPPRRTPVLNADIGVLSVPVSGGSAAAVESAIRGVAPPGTRVEVAADFGIAGDEAGT